MYIYIHITFQPNKVKVEWAGEDGLNSIEEIELLNGTVETNQIKNDVGRSVWTFTLDTELSIKHRKLE